MLRAQPLIPTSYKYFYRAMTHWESQEPSISKTALLSSSHPLSTFSSADSTALPTPISKTQEASASLKVSFFKKDAIYCSPKILHTLTSGEPKTSITRFFKNLTLILNSQALENLSLMTSEEDSSFPWKNYPLSTSIFLS